MVGRCVVGLALLGLLGAGCAPSPAPVARVERAPEEMPQIILKALKEGSDFELWSIGSLGRGKPSPVKMGNFDALGFTKVKSPETREQLTKAFLDSAFADSQMVAACEITFRHGIRVRYEGTKFDILICFECKEVFAYQDTVQVARCHIGTKPEPLFDKVLTEAGVPLAEKPK